MVFTAPCFSGECGFCPGCCKSSTISNEPECLQRANDLSKFLGKQKIAEELNLYNQSLNQLIKKYDYRNPKDPGFLPTILKYGDTKYKLLSKYSHSNGCDNVFCKIFYLNSHDHMKSTHYTKLPIYTRSTDNKHRFCGVCMLK